MKKSNHSTIKANIPIYLLFVFLTATTCQKKQNPNEAEKEFDLLELEFTQKFGGDKKWDSSDFIRDYFLQKGFTQVPIEDKSYRLAGVHDPAAGPTWTTQSRCGYNAFIKKTELGIGVMVVLLTCSSNPYVLCRDYFFRRSEIDSAPFKCDMGNSVTYEKYYHSDWIDGKHYGIDKTVSTIELCFDGKYLTKSEVIPSGGNVFTKRKQGQ